MIIYILNIEFKFRHCLTIIIIRAFQLNDRGIEEKGFRGKSQFSDLNLDFEW